MAQTNALFLRGEINPYLAQRLSELIPEIQGNDRLFEYQDSVLKHNKNVLNLQAQKFEGVERTASKFLSKQPVPSLSKSKVDLGILGAAAACQLKTGKEALQHILPLLESRPDDVGLLLTAIQFYVRLETPAAAINLLEAFFKRLEVANTPDHADVRFAPGLVALAVSLYRIQGRYSSIRSELAKAAVHWQKKTDPGVSGPGVDLLRAAGIELLRSSHPADLAAAGKAFSHLIAARPNDPVVRAGIVASFATTDIEKAQPYLDVLPLADEETANVDVQALLAAGVASPPPVAQPARGKKRTLDEADESAVQKQQQPQQPAAKKRRKRKLPKSYDPDKKPDPERWLPMRDRSYYKPPKGKKGKRGRAAEATMQGGIVREEQETLELAGGAGSVKVEKAPAGGGGGGGKKKKKGKK